jgi:glutathione S-transferase
MSYELIIGTKNWSTWSLRAWLALKATDIPFKEVLVPLRQAESAALIKSYSPSERVPVLRILSSWEIVLSSYASEGGFLFGQFSIADCMYAPVVSRFLTYDIPMPGIVSEYAAKVVNLPSMQEWRESSKREIDKGLPDQWTVDMVRNAR